MAAHTFSGGYKNEIGSTTEIFQRAARAGVALNFQRATPTVAVSPEFNPV